MGHPHRLGLPLDLAGAWTTPTATGCGPACWREAAAHIEAQRTPRIHNYENWLNAALGTLGTALGDETLARTVINDTYGLTDQLARGVLDDGHWYEGASSYHYYTLGAILYLAQAREGLPGDPRGNPTMAPDV